MKKALSIVLLCLMVASVASLIVIAVNLVISINDLGKNLAEDPGPLPGLSMLIAPTVAVATCLEFLLYGFYTALIGFVASIINCRITTNRIVRRISQVTLGINSVVLYLNAGVFALLVIVCS